MLRNDHGGIGRNVTPQFPGAFFHDKTSEAAQVHVFSVLQRLFYGTHKGLYRSEYLHFVYACTSGNLLYNVSFSHFCNFLVLTSDRLYPKLGRQIYRACAKIK